MHAPRELTGKTSLIKARRSRDMHACMHAPRELTGKTSRIKALAHHTGRSIINVPLARLSTNQQLMDLMYDLKLQASSRDLHACACMHMHACRRH